MTREHARSLLGMSDTATDAEIANAYRRLMQTVHPDICTGPEAERLARDATDARAILSRKEEPRPGRGPRTRADWSRYQDHDEQQLQEIVLRVLDQSGGTATATTLTMQILRETRGIPHHQRRAWNRRMTDIRFWNDGQALGLWKIDGNRISRRTDAEPTRQQREPENWTDQWEAETRRAARKHHESDHTTAPERRAGWAASTTVVAGVTVAAALTASTAGDPDWTSTERASSYIALTLVNIGLLVLLSGESIRLIDLSRPWRVLLPGVTGGALAAWAILHAMTEVSRWLQ